MGVYIKGMKMPATCQECEFAIPGVDFAYCERYENTAMDFSVAENGRPNWCPLVEVPPHGRLIDADALHTLFEEQWHYLQVLDWDENPAAEPKQAGVNWCINTMHDNAPTIIEAEGET